MFGELGYSNQSSSSFFMRAILFLAGWQDMPNAPVDAGLV